MKEYKIMVVDDEPDISDLLEKTLAIEGFHRILKVAHGKDAVKICREETPDLIILDVCCPIWTVMKCAGRSGSFSRCPVLFLSAKNDELDKILGLAVGGDDYVTKPFSPREVAYRVRPSCAGQNISRNPRPPG